MAFDIVSLVNLILSAAIAGVAHWGYLKGRNKMLLYVSMAFGLFSLSHLLILAGLEEALTMVVIALRMLGYLLMLFAVSLGLQYKAG
jgi:hypothetical protein